MKPGTKVGIGIASGLAAVLFFSLLLLTLSQGEDDRLYRRMSSDELRRQYSIFEEGFHGHLDREKECKGRGQIREAESHHEDARMCYKEMQLIRAELERRGKW